ncbi:MAG: MFS transporter, partial [Rhodoluna sp.]
RAPGFLRVITSQLYARFPFGMMTLAFVMHIQFVHHSYAVAGLALGADTIGAAISGPVLGRLLGKYGTTRVLLTTAIIGAAAIAGIGLLNAPPIGMIAMALVVGLTSPPIQTAARTIYPTLVKKKDLPAVYSLDATSQELIWVIGPVLATVLAAQVNTSFVVVLMAVIQVSGAIWFCSNREVNQMVIPSPNRRMGGVLANKVVLTTAILGLLLIGGFSGVEVGTVAVVPKTLAGVIIGALSLGSIVGGLLLGNRVKSRWSLTLLLGLVLLGYLLLWIAPTNAIWISICLFIAGVGVAPSLGILGTAIASNLKAGDAAEANGWASTGQLMGYSAGAALSGIAIDSVSNTSAFLVSIVFGVGAILVSLMAVDIMSPNRKQD